MKILIPSNGDEMDSIISPVFARSNNLLIFNIENNTITINNQQKNPIKEKEHAGKLITKYLKENNINTIITYRIGKKAEKLLKENKINIYQAKVGTIEENIDLYTKKQLAKISN